MSGETPRTKNNSARLVGIDASRGIAALLVVLYHVEITVARPTYWDVDPLNGLFLFGGRGVDFFFVLSGFIITFVHWKDLGNAARIPLYAYKRLVRIYPILWAVALPYLLLSLVMGAETMPSTLGGKINVFASTLLLLPSPYFPVPGVIWTLKHEIFFYLLFAIALWKPRLSLAGLAIWFCLCVSNATDRRYASFLTDFFFSPFNLEFMFGVGCGAALRQMKIPRPGLVLGLGLVGFTSAAVNFVEVEIKPSWIIHPTTLVQVLQFGLSSVLIVLGLGQLDLLGKTQVPSFFKLLGAASYSIYLVHLPIIVIAAKCVKYSALTSPLAVFSLLSVLGVAAGIAVHLLVERPLTNVFRLAGSERAQPDGKET